jgi:Enoyl-CoA hydratase/isomerase
MFYTGQRIPAAEMYRIGGVEAVVPRRQLLSEARVLADEIASKDPVAIRMAKASVVRIDTLPLEAAYRTEQDYTRHLSAYENSAAAIARFTEKGRSRPRSSRAAADTGLDWSTSCLRPGSAAATGLGSSHGTSWHHVPEAWSCCEVRHPPPRHSCLRPDARLKQPRRVRDVLGDCSDNRPWCQDRRSIVRKRLQPQHILCRRIDHCTASRPAPVPPDGPTRRECAQAEHPHGSPAIPPTGPRRTARSSHSRRHRDRREPRSTSRTSARRHDRGPNALAQVTRRRDAVVGVLERDEI